MFLTLPTLLTWTRIVAIPLIVGVFYLPLAPHTANLVATVMFMVFAWTDWLKRVGGRISMDGKGRCIDNIFIERPGGP